jgi:glycosyltransferase involved in cell wall biosynthesis
MKLAYITNARIPSERANSVQTAQMCAAFASAGAQVTLYHPRRRNLPEFSQTDLWAYYGLPRSFEQKLIPCLDWFHLSAGRLWLERPVFLIQTLSFALALLVTLFRSPPDAYYSRDPFVVALLVLALPGARQKILFEAHTLPQSKLGRAFRKWTLAQARGTVTISHALERAYVQLGLTPQTVTTAPDGVDLNHFKPNRSKAEARAQLQLPPDQKLIVYTGGLYRGRGLEELIGAVRDLANTTLVIVGGKVPKETERLQTLARSLGVNNLCFEGHRAPTEIPNYLAAADILAMPYSKQTHSPAGVTTDWMSPLKMFEYLAAGRAIIASDLPALREVLIHDQNAWLVEPDSAAALATGLKHLTADPSLCDRLSIQARLTAENFSWENRARFILSLFNHFSEWRV